MHWNAPHVRFASPHYDVHMYLVDRSELDNVCSESNLENVLPETLIKELIQKGIPVPGVGAANRSASQSSTPFPTTVPAIPSN